MDKNRLEVFSDGVLAIIITIIVIEMKVPAGDSIQDLIPPLPTLPSYLLSFFCLGIFLSGLKDIHWILYFPAVFATLGGVTGYCPGAMFSKLIFKNSMSKNGPLKAEAEEPQQQGFH